MVMEVKHLNKMMINKKHLLSAVALILAATMIIIPTATATYGYFYYQSHYNVVTPGNACDQVKDTYAIFGADDSKIVVLSTVNTLGSPAKIYVTGFKTGSPQATSLWGSTTGNSGWTLIGWVNLPTSTGTVSFSNDAGGYKYFAIANEASAICIDEVYSQYTTIA
jgi:hypothetical protein